MLDIQLVRTRPDLVKQALANRQLGNLDSVDRILALDAERRQLLNEVETLKAERNTVSKEIGKMKDAAERQAKIDAMKAVGDRIDALDARIREVDAERDTLLYTLPNIPDKRTPIGASDEENIVLRQEGDLPTFAFTPRPHWELGVDLDIIDFERGVKLSGSRFYLLAGAGARLQRALIAWMLDLHTRQGYREIYPPFVVKEINFLGAGQLPKFRDNIYHDAEDDLWLVTTAEVPLTNLHRDEILDPDQLPRLYTAYTPCFRREKVSAGKDVRGIKRGHQFDKVEMYIYCRPEDSEAMHQKMLADAEETCRLLGFTYRVKQLVTADISFAATMTYDIEVWSPGCEEWLEVSSVSNTTDFQSRRANIRYRPEAGVKPAFPHTLNGSGLGLPRTLIAVIENYQQPDGSIVIPNVLRPFMGGLDVIRPETA